VRRGNLDRRPESPQSSLLIITMESFENACLQAHMAVPFVHTLMLAGQQQHSIPPFLKAVNFPQGQVRAATNRLVFTMLTHLKAMYLTTDEVAH
jgi:hypothetical protein